jgi:hypothetical protein
MPVVARVSEVHGSSDTEVHTVSKGAAVFELIGRVWTGYPPTVVVTHEACSSASDIKSDAELRPIAKLWESFERPRPTLSRLEDPGESSPGAVVRRSGRPKPSMEMAVRNRSEAAIALIEEWLADESGYDEETWPKLKDALEKDRPSSRKLFRD